MGARRKPDNTPIPLQQQFKDTPVRPLRHSITEYRPSRANNYESANHVSSTHQKKPEWQRSRLDNALTPSTQLNQKGRDILAEVIDAFDAKRLHIMIALAVEAALVVPASALSPLGLRLPADGILAFDLQARNR
jgi:hypothetical protein